MILNVSGVHEKRQKPDAKTTARLMSQPGRSLKLQRKSGAASHTSAARILLCTGNRESCIVRIGRRFSREERGSEATVSAEIDQSLRTLEQKRVALLVQNSSPRRFLRSEDCVRRQTVRCAHGINVS